MFYDVQLADDGGMLISLHRAPPANLVAGRFYSVGAQRARRSVLAHALFANLLIHTRVSVVFHFNISL